MTYDLHQLCDLTDVTPRTVRYYIQQGLLPSPGASGPGAHYTEAHLHRLNLIRKLQKEHLPLAEIRDRLEELDDNEVARAARSASSAARASAGDYVRNLLHDVTRSSPPRAPDPPAYASDRSTWERIRLDRDVELHVRRPLSRVQNKQVDALIAAARQLFETP